jgi:hypothetical protein
MTTLNLLLTQVSIVSICDYVCIGYWFFFFCIYLVFAIKFELGYVGLLESLFFMMAFC